LSNTLIDGLCFGEGPRWHDGALWLSDMHGQVVLKVSSSGETETVIELEDEQPSGLGWMPNGDLLVVGMSRRQVLRYDGTSLSVHADLADLASFHCNDMVVDDQGRAYVGNFGFDLAAGAKPQLAELIMIDPNGTPKIVDNEMKFPNGSVITADGSTLIVAETFGGRLTAFDRNSDGELSNRRVWAELPEKAVPDGICLDAGGGVWSASPTTNECVRQLEGGEITHRIDTEQPAFACMIGEDKLYVLTSSSSIPKECRERRDARVVIFDAPFPGAGLP